MRYLSSCSEHQKVIESTSDIARNKRMVNDHLRIIIVFFGIGQSPNNTGVSSVAQSTSAPASAVAQTGPISSVGVTQSAAATAATTAGKLTES